MANGQWDIERVIQQVPPTYVPSILSTQLHLQQGLPDLPILSLTTNGEFSFSSAWNEIREKRTKTKINTCTWHKNIPFKCSFLVWRAIRSKLPTNEKINSFGGEPSDCYCCNNMGMDTIEHTFNSGKFAKYMWKYFADSLGMQTLRYLLMRWWSTEYKNKAHKLIMQSTPIFICWNLWKNRCVKKYGGKHSNIAKVKFAVFKDTFRLLHTVFPYIEWPSSWTKLVPMIEGCTHETKVTLVQWNKPQNQWIKLNANGSALSNTGRIEVGGILRNSTGELIMAYAVPLGEGTNNQAETYGPWIERRSVLVNRSSCQRLGKEVLIHGHRPRTVV
ncbi:hypothetical protein MTR67_040229 [Solanum verrucosum]|uniref:Reverse transcriptase zinc-binding domain-containing protein n=1 Tax=Solanum verrucosum TaxID=315347 RepID=A0AAF0UKF2_SOLVR|nr:hypothetical protein MTR67_040229 [Solanum verrucosum]